MPLDVPTIQRLVEQYAPVVYLDKAEEYLPASLDWYLPLVSLKDQNGVTVNSAVTEAVVATAAATDYLEITDTASTEPGNLPSAPFYVRFTEVAGSGSQFDIEYWFFYAFNGCSSAGVELELLHARPKKTLQIPPFGEHEGDWEHITVRIDGTSYDVVAVFMSQHGWGTWYLPGQYSVLTGTSRPIVYSAFHSHASYPRVGMESIKEVNIGIHDFKLKIGLFDQTNSGTLWDPLANAGPGAVLASVNVAGVEYPGALWTDFHGHWGPPTDQNAIVDAATEVIYHALGVHSGALKDEIRKLLTDLCSVILPGGPANPSEQKSWANGEPTSPGG